jgi:catechol 2,3-dioxygenase-like lactoylglutathione lyase family enzyme
MKAQWTHLALHVHSLKASIDFYAHYTNLRVVDRHSDASSTGMDVAWLSDRSPDNELNFVMVLQEGDTAQPSRRDTAAAPRSDQPSGFRSRFPRGGGRSSRGGQERRPAEIRSHFSESVCGLPVHHWRSGRPYGGVLLRPSVGESHSLTIGSHGAMTRAQSTRLELRGLRLAKRRQIAIKHKARRNPA